MRLLLSHAVLAHPATSTIPQLSSAPNEDGVPAYPGPCGPFSASTIGRPAVVHFPSFSEVGLTVCASARIEPTAHRPQASRKMVLVTRPWSAIMESLHKRQLWTIQPNNLYRCRLVVGTDSAEGSVRAADQRGDAKVAKGAKRVKWRPLPERLLRR